MAVTSVAFADIEAAEKDRTVAIVSNAVRHETAAVNRVSVKLAVATIPTLTLYNPPTFYEVTGLEYRLEVQIIDLWTSARCTIAKDIHVDFVFRRIK